MSILSVFIIAIGLAMDAFAVSVSRGIALKRMQATHALFIASFFGVFQAVMPFIGWHAGQWARSYVAVFDHWIAFGLLVLIGSKMIYESLQSGGSRIERDPLNLCVLFVLAIATSVWYAVVVLQGATALPRWMAAVNPLLMTLVYMILARKVVPFRVMKWIHGAGFNIVYIVFFALLLAFVW